MQGCSLTGALELEVPRTAAVLLIPAFKPGLSLIEMVETLTERWSRAVIVVDDGSGPAFTSVFDRILGLPGVMVLHHAVNLGKGAALKTGLNYIACTFPNSAGAVTADADGQHSPEDIDGVARKLEQNPDSLILGARSFGTGVPARSRFGNVLTCAMVRLLVGHQLSDTQTGLRGVPLSLIPDLLPLTSNRYEFELDMLITAKHQQCPLLQVPIQTIYLDGNSSSHFNPIFDSMKIYFVLLRFSFVSLLTAILDNVVFLLSFQLSHSIGLSQTMGRLVACIFNYSAARKAVFLSRGRHSSTLPKYLGLVIVGGLTSYALIKLLVSLFPLSPVIAKIIAETILFLANFAIQRDFVFRRTRSATTPAQTDWTTYYQKVPITAKLTRRYTARMLDKALRLAGVQPGRDLHVIEIGGANSCFLDYLLQRLQPSKYDVIDTNAFGLDLLRSHPEFGRRLYTLQQSVFELDLRETADVVFSVGLIEHFDQQSTRAAIGAHFDSVKPGGVVLLTFPRPTPLYRVTRGLLEFLGLWKFPDERPLQPTEVLDGVRTCGQVIHQKLLWPLMLTQHLIVARRHAVENSIVAVDRVSSVSA